MEGRATVEQEKGDMQEGVGSLMRQLDKVGQGRIKGT